MAFALPKIGLSDQTRNFQLDDRSKWWQRPFDGIPYELSRDVFIVVTIDVARTRHLFPRDMGVPGLEFGRRRLDASEMISRHRVTA